MGLEKWAAKRVPDTRQETDFSCGAAALLAVIRGKLGAKSPYRTEVELRKALNTTADKGTEAKDIVRVAKEVGFEARVEVGMKRWELERTLARGAVVLVAYQAHPDEPGKDLGESLEDGHWAVADGYEEGDVVLMDPASVQGHIRMKGADLERRWRDLDENNEPVIGLAVVIR